MVFKKPDEDVIMRLSPYGIRVLLESLYERRTDALRPINQEIKFYEDLLIEKGDANAKASSAIRAS